jgi:hypothetical protein
MVLEMATTVHSIITPSTVRTRLKTHLRKQHPGLRFSHTAIKALAALLDERLRIVLDTTILTSRASNQANGLKRPSISLEVLQKQMDQVFCVSRGVSQEEEEEPVSTDLSS